MELQDSEKELWSRYYIWTKNEWEKEVNDSFPHLRMVRTGHAWDLYQFMSRLNKKDQLALALGRVKKASPEWAAKWGDHLSEEEASICQKFDVFSHARDQFQVFNHLRYEGKMADAKIVFDLVCARAAKTLCDTDSSDARVLSTKLDAFSNSIPPSLEEQIRVRKLAGEQIKLISKKKLQKILTKKVRDVFGSEYTEYRVDEGHWTAFDIKCGGWMVTTQFNFGRQPGLLGHWHNVGSERKAPHPVMPEVMYPVVILCRGLGWPCSWQWEHLTEEDVESACDETFKHCRRFLEAAPSLLKGLDVEGIAKN